MKYYLTTPIYYVNAAPHIGTAYSTFVADLVKRFKKMDSCDPVVFTTGSDEHSRNVEKAAKAAGLGPEEYCTRMVVEFTRSVAEAGHRLRPLHPHVRSQAPRDRALAVRTLP